jgi:hypothetical protein
MNKEFVRTGNGELGIGNRKLSQISTSYVTDTCRKHLPFLRQDVVTNTYLFCYQKNRKFVANIY